jgi:hypothetical protein
MANRSLASVTSTSRASHYRVYLHLDTDGAWVSGGHAIPLRLLGRFISDGVVQPVWETEGTPVSVGRAMRILPDHTRRLITDRDRGCRFPGCTSTAFTEVHHLEAWSDGGRTDIDNQILLCTTHLDDPRTAYRPPTGGPIRWSDLELPPDTALGRRHLTAVPPPEPEPEFVSRLDDPANPDRGLVRVL